MTTNSLFHTILHWSTKNYPLVAALNSCDYKDTFTKTHYDFLIAVGKEPLPLKNTFHSLKNYCANHQTWLFGYLGYDLKNELEKLTSSNFDGLHWENIQFFVPEFVFSAQNGDVQILNHKGNCHTESDSIKKQFVEFTNSTVNSESKIMINSRVSKSEYIDKVNQIKQHIQRGDVYELNYCQEFYAENTRINPLEIYKKLIDISPTPFSAFYRSNNHYLLCASPERFLKKEGKKLLSQPIKGTIKRGATPEEDLHFKEMLKNSEKEQSENVMVVDMVRNDLSKTAAKKSVKVEELFGIYPFNQVFQMISTVSSELHENYDGIDAIAAAFPMASMTGTPKVKALELIEQFEKTKRGLYSGAVGYFTPQGDFDFNVVIRSIQYHAEKKYLSYMVGSAITINSNAEHEYEECLLKAEAIVNVLTSNKLN